MKVEVKKSSTKTQKFQGYSSAYYVEVTQHEPEDFCIFKLRWGAEEMTIYGEDVFLTFCELVERAKSLFDRPNVW